MTSLDKSNDVKKLALDGKFQEIESKYGSKARTKARDYATSKLELLVSKFKDGGDMSAEKCATAFMLFAMERGETDIETIAKEFTVHISSQPQSDDIEVHAEFEDDGALETTKVTCGASSVVCDGEIEVAENNADAALSEDRDKNTDNARDKCKDGVVAVPRSVVKPATSKETFYSPSSTSKFTAPKRALNGTVKKAGSLPSNVVPNESHMASKKSAASMAGKRQSKVDKKLSKKKKIDPKDTKPVKRQSFPHAPKRPRNCYMFFSDIIRQDVLRENPDLAITDVAKKVAEHWKNVTPDEKNVYEIQAREDKLRFEKEMQEYKVNYPEEATALTWKSKGGKGSQKRTISQGPDAKKSKPKKKGKRSSEQTDDEDSLEGSASDVSDDVAQPQKMSSRYPKQTKGKTVIITPSKVTPLTAKGKSGPTRQLPPQRKELCPTGSLPMTPTQVAAESAVLVSSLKGIKEEDLPISESIQRVSQVPIERSPYPPDFTPKKGEWVILVLEPYKEFLAKLNPDAIGCDIREVVDEVCALPSPIVNGCVLEMEEITLTGQCRENIFDTTEGSDAGMNGNTSDDDEIEMSRPKGPRRQGLKVNRHQGELSAWLLTLRVDKDSCYRIIYVPFSSPALTSDIYLLDRKEYARSLRAPWLVVNAQVRRAFASDTEGEVEWLEGSIYYIREDITTNPYNAVIVTWLRMEEGSDAWFYASTQEANECSPWDLQLSRFVLPQNVHPPSLPDSLIRGPVTPEAVLQYIKSLDFASVFMYKLTFAQEYCLMFPNKDDRLDLHVLTLRCKQGCYNSLSKEVGKDNRKGMYEGLMRLFEDLDRMVANGKHFNDCNRGFQAWRLCDMVEKTVLDLRRKLSLMGGCKGPLASGFGKPKNADIVGGTPTNHTETCSYVTASQNFTQKTWNSGYSQEDRAFATATQLLDLDEV